MSSETVYTYLGNYYEVETIGSASTTRSYYSAGSQRLAMRLNADLYYLLGDHLGSTSLSYKAVGDVVQTQTYKAWGENRWPTTSALPTMLRYTGQRAETSLGIYFYGSRWYDQWTGRFLQADTVVPGAGNPGAWDRYAGMLNNPLKYIDPTGHTSACAYGNRDPECDASYKDRYTPPDVPLTPGGRWVQDQFLGMKKEKDKWWNVDGEFTIEEFIGLWILHEAEWGVDDYVIRALLISQTIAQNLYVGGYNPAYCHTSACFNGAFNFMSAQTGEHSAGGFMKSIQKPGLYRGPGNMEEKAIGPASNFGNRAIHPAFLNPDQYGAATQWGNNPALSPDYFRDNNLEQRLIYNGTDLVYYYWSSFFIYSVDQANLWR